MAAIYAQSELRAMLKKPPVNPVRRGKPYRLAGGAFLRLLPGERDRLAFRSKALRITAKRDLDRVATELFG